MKRAIILLSWLAIWAFTWCAATPLAGEQSADEAISPAEAAQLVQKQAPGIAIADTVVEPRIGKTVLRVSGDIDRDHYVVLVDATVPRVTSVAKNGEEIYKWKGIVAVGHRGTVKYAPENTLSAYNKAIELGARVVEMDVRQTKDGHFVLMHDSTVFRTTGGTGLVSLLTLAEIKQLDAGASFGRKFVGERVPTLEEGLDAIQGRALPDVDFKAGDPGKLVEILRTHGLLGRVTLCSESQDVIRQVAEISNGAILIRPKLPNASDPVKELADTLHPPLVNCDSPERFRDIHRAGMKVFTNTMSEPGNEADAIQTAIDASADYIQTDRLDILVPLLKERGIYAPMETVSLH